MLGAVKLTKNADFDKYKYYGYGIEFDACRSFSLADVSLSLSDSTFGKNIMIFGADMSSSENTNNKKIYILVRVQSTG